MSALFMRATTEREYNIVQHEDGTYSGWEYVNHPSPSGYERWMPTIEDNRKWPTQRAALRQIKLLCLYLDLQCCEHDLAGDKYQEVVHALHDEYWETLRDEKMEMLEQELERKGVE